MNDQERSLKKRNLFGTDGIRDRANQGRMTPELALRLGQGYVSFLRKKRVKKGNLSLCIGQDTRKSSDTIALACAAGAMSAGADVYDLGVIPTPGVSHMIGALNTTGGIMISASHNPWEYNGIKLFSETGEKLPDVTELAIEEEMESEDSLLSAGADMGVLIRKNPLETSYFETLQNRFRELPPLEKPLVLDCAHGATSYLVKEALKTTGRKDILLIGAEPQGTNINLQAGVMDMTSLMEAVRHHGACAGMAFDGDADRVLLVDSRGRQINGDIMLWVLGMWRASQESSQKGVVATLMSNLALEEHLGKRHIPVHRCAVGDRYVLEKMKETGALLGGEQSGHLIVLPNFASGDGPRGGFLFLQACAELGENLDTLVDRFAPYPQCLENIQVHHRDSVMGAPVLRGKKEYHEKTLGSQGRIFIRPSGTEPLIRILVESKKAEIIPPIVQDLKACILDLEKAEMEKGA